MAHYEPRMMIWLPCRQALRNPIFHGALEAFWRQGTCWSYAFNYLVALSMVLFITWPREGFLSLRDLPFTYNALGAAVIIILAYLNLSQGARKLLGSMSVSLHDWLALAQVSAGAFLRGYLAAHCLDLFLFWGLSWPLMVLAAGVAGEPVDHLGAGMGIILVCMASYRIVGVTLLMLFERDEFLLYILVRLCYVFVILVNGFIAPVSNPVLALVDASIWPKHLSPVQCLGLTVRGWVVTIGLHLLLGGLFFIIALIRVHYVQRRAVASGVGEEEYEV